MRACRAYIGVLGRNSRLETALQRASRARVDAADRMTAESLAHHREQLARVVAATLARKARHQRERKHGRRDAPSYRFLDRPATLARIRDDGSHVAQSWVVGEKCRGEIEQPRAHDASMTPRFGDPRDVELEVAPVMHQRKAFRERLHHPVLDPVVDGASASTSSRSEAATPIADDNAARALASGS